MMSECVRTQTDTQLGIVIDNENYSPHHYKIHQRDSGSKRSMEP